MLHQYFAKFEFIFVLIFYYNLSVFISFHISIYCSYEQCWIVSSFSIRLIDHTLWNHALTELFQFLLFYNWYYWTEYIHVYGIFPFCLICCCSVAKSCWTLWYFMNCSTPGFPVLHYLLEFAQTPAASFASLPFIFNGKSNFSNPQLWCPGTLSAPILQLTLLLFSPARSIITHVCHWWSG